MSSQDTLRTAEAERQKAKDFEFQAQDTLTTAQNQAQYLRAMANAHADQASRYTQNAQQGDRDDLMKNAEAERQQAANLEQQAQSLFNTAQQEADGVRGQANVSMKEADRLTQKSQQEQQQEAKKLAEAAREDQEKHDRLKNLFRR